MEPASDNYLESFEYSLLPHFTLKIRFNNILPFTPCSAK